MDSPVPHFLHIIKQKIYIGAVFYSTCAEFSSVELLLSNSSVNGILELNAKNSRGLTAMDVLDIVIDSPSDVQLKDILHRAGAFGAPNVQCYVSSAFSSAGHPQRAN
ncbi:hypothetical protein L1049_018090 [Liquidambar formosana]|uniref:Uncharacterized protein n=1 Tax=Liquidambar formosana TaxID=63359 RepID=A0AAP0R9L3_LIQFO